MFKDGTDRFYYAVTDTEQTWIYNWVSALDVMSWEVLWTGDIICKDDQI